MSFEYMEYLVEKNQFDDIQIIGKTIESQGQPYYFLAMVKKEEQAQLCIMAQTEPWADSLGDDHSTMRQSMRASLRWTGSAVDISKIKINDQELEIGGGQFGILNENSMENIMLLAKLADAGWRMPRDSVFYQMDWSCIELMQAEIRTPLQQFPDWEHARVGITWGQRTIGYCVEKPVRLAVSTGAQPEQAPDRDGGMQKVSFKITSKDGTERDAVCYLNSVTLIDMWAEYDKQFADPEYQKKVREHVSEEEFENMKQEMYRALEQECPRGMCYFGIEYECECDVDLSLQFYAADYLESAPVVHHGSASIYLSISKADREFGVHGLKLRACVIHTPVAPDTKELQAELFDAYELIPEREEEFVF